MIHREKHPLAEALRALADAGKGDARMLYQRAEQLELIASSLGLPGLEGRNAYQEAAGDYYKLTGFAWDPLWTEDPHVDHKEPVKRAASKGVTVLGKRKAKKRPAKKKVVARPVIPQPITGKPFDAPDDPANGIIPDRPAGLIRGHNGRRLNSAQRALAEVDIQNSERTVRAADV